MRSKLAIAVAALMVPLLGGCTWPFLDEQGLPLSEIAVFGSPLPDRHDIPYAHAPTPTFGLPTSTGDGFTVKITNFDPSFNWVLTSTAGTVNLLDGGLVSVSGLASDTAAQVTVLVQKYNFYDAQASITGASLPYDDYPGGYWSAADQARAANSGLPTPARLGLRGRDWKRLKPTPSCALATKCRTAAFRNTRAAHPLHYLETDVVRFRNAGTASAQYTRMLQPFASSQQAAQRRQQGFRYAVIGGLGTLQLPAHDVGSATDATLAVIAQKGRFVQLVVVTGDTSYLAGNARTLLASRASRILIKMAGHAAELRPPLGRPAP